MERATVLLAEDDESVLLAVGDALEGAGYRVVRARSGKEALAAMKEMGSGDGEPEGKGRGEETGGPAGSSPRPFPSDSQQNSDRFLSRFLDHFPRF